MIDLGTLPEHTTNYLGTLNEQTMIDLGTLPEHTTNDLGTLNEQTMIDLEHFLSTLQIILEHLMNRL